MAKEKSHKEVEFHVGDKVFSTFAEAADIAVVKALTTGESVDIDVVIWGPSGARWFGGDDAVEEYNEDPEASVFRRVEVRAQDVGRVP